MDIQSAVAFAASCAIPAGRTGIPILEHIRLHDGEASGTDMDLWASARCDDLPDADICVHGQHLKACLGKASAIDVRDGSIVVTSGRAKSVLPTLNPADWPKPEEFEAEGSVLIPDAGNVMKRLLAFIPRNDLVRGMDCLHIDGGTLVGGSAHRIAYVDGYLGNSEYPVSVPAKAVELIAKVGGDAEIQFNQRLARIRVGAVEIVTRLMGKAYPDWRRIFAGDPGEAVSIKAQDWRDALQAVRWAIGDEVTLIDGAMVAKSNAGEARADLGSDLDWPPTSWGYDNLSSALAAFGKPSVSRRQSAGANVFEFEEGNMRAVVAQLRR